MTDEKKLTGYPSIDKPWLKYYPEEAIETPLFEGTTYDYLWESNKNYPENIALSYYGCKIRYRELFSNIDAAAAAFAALGIRRGDVVVISSVTTPETIYAFYALNRLGAISNMIDPRTSIEGIHDYIEEVDSKVIMTIDAAYPKILEAVRNTNVEKIIVVSPADSLTRIKKKLYLLKNKPVELSSAGLRWDDFISQGSGVALNTAAYHKDQCCVIIHTGGTTGTPKGVMLSNDNINALVQQSILTGIDMQRHHNWMDIMPPFIAYGIGMGIHLPLVIGMELILIPSFDPKRFDQLLIKYNPIHMVFVPSYWGTIINSKRLKKTDLSFIIAPTVGGDTMPPALEMAANHFLKEHGCSYTVTKGYGMTEVSAGVTGTLDVLNEPGSVGSPFVKTIISIFDPETGNELQYNQMGEICISGPNVMLGYYKNETATKETIRQHKDGSTWVHSGDLGYMNENGSLFIVDRIKKMIIRYDGFKVFPSQIEKVIASHNSVQGCCVVGSPDSEHAQGNLPVAFVVLNSSATEWSREIISELKELCYKELPEYAQPVDYFIVPNLPVTPIGKIDYRKLEKMALNTGKLASIKLHN